MDASPVLPPVAPVVAPQSLRAWLQAFRLFSYTASVIPVLLGAALVVYQEQTARWWLLPLIIPAAVLIHAGTNLVSEYFDYKKNVDRPETYGSSRALVDQLLRPRQVLWAGLICFALTGALGLIFIMVCGRPIFYLGVIGILGGFFYTAAPVGYKYLGVGDLMVFCLMGPLMVIGSFLVLTGGYNHQVLLVSVPVGLLTAAILSGNNLRDIRFDRVVHIHTTASLLGHRVARWEYSFLVIGAYIATVAMVLARLLPWWSLLTLLTVPLAAKVVAIALRNRPDDPKSVATLDVQTAQMHLPFGLLLIISLLLERWL